MHKSQIGDEGAVIVTINNICVCRRMLSWKAKKKLLLTSLL